MFVDVLRYNEFKIDSSRWVYFVMGFYCYFELFYILSSFYYLENVIYYKKKLCNKDENILNRFIF